MAKRRSRSRGKGKADNYGWVWLLVLGAVLYLTVLYWLPMLLAAVSAGAAWLAYRASGVTRRNWGIAAGIVALVTVGAFNSRRAELVAEESQRVRDVAAQADQQAKNEQAARDRQATERAVAKQRKVAAEALKPGLRGTVVNVIDGDTLTVKLFSGKLEKVRLIGVDAPELRQGEWGKRSKLALSKLIAGSKVRLTTDAEPRDRYGRLLAYVWRGENMVNYQLVKAGVADTLFDARNLKYKASLTAGKGVAQDQSDGIWSVSNGLELSPSAFRRGNCPIEFEGRDVITDPRAPLPTGVSCAQLEADKRNAVVYRDSSGVTAVAREPAASAVPNYGSKCGSYPDQPSAQAAFEAYGYSRMDRDKDGIACESN